MGLWHAPAGARYKKKVHAGGASSVHRANAYAKLFYQSVVGAQNYMFRTTNKDNTTKTQILI
jgi:hypothetical protein